MKQYTERGQQVRFADQYMPLLTPNLFKIYNNWNYCYTHGCDIHNLHTSAMCKNLVYWHNLEATQNNMMGGFTKR